MPIFDKFKNKVFRKRLENRIIEKRELKITPEEVIEAVVEAVITDTSLIQRSKTLQRLDILEALGVWSTTSILKNNGDIANNKDAIAAIQNKLPTQDQLDRAKYVWDSTDNNYKNVKSIVINNANNADRVWDPGSNTYVTITDLSIHKHLLPLTGGTITGDLEINGVLTNREAPVATQEWVKTNFSPKEEGGPGRDDIVTINTVQTITAKKTFSEVISQPTIPTEDDHVANKKYVDDEIQKIYIQPETALSEYLKKKDAETTYYKAKDSEDLYNHYMDLNDHTLRLDKPMITQTVQGPVEYQQAPVYTGTVAGKDLPDNAYLTKGMLKEGLRNNVLLLKREQQQVVNGPIDFKVAPTINGQALPDTSSFVRKDEVLETLCEECGWVGDLQRQTTINGNDIDALQAKLEGDILYVQTREFTVLNSEITQTLSGAFYYYTFTHDISDWDTDIYKIVTLTLNELYKVDLNTGAMISTGNELQGALCSIAFDDNKLYGTFMRPKNYDTSTGKTKAVVSVHYKKMIVNGD